MKIIISKKLNKIFNDAVLYAREAHHKYLTIEHIFMALTKDEEIIHIFDLLNVKISKIQNHIKQYFDQYMETIDAEHFTYKPKETVPLSNIIDEMFKHIKSSNRKEASVTDMLVAMFQDEKSYSYKILQSCGVKKITILEILSQNSNYSVNQDTAIEDIKHEYVEKYCINLTELAKRDKLDPVIGRDDEIEQTMQVLCRRRKNNPMLLGEPGVGKTAIVEGLARNISTNQAPEVLQNSTIYALNIGTLIAGTKYRGDFEKRLKGIIDDIISIKKSILFIDEAHTLIGAGSVNDNSIDAANILKPYLARGDIKCIGASTHEEYKANFEKDKAMSRRFSKVIIKEPSLDDSFLILKGLKDKYQKHHKITYNDTVLKTIIDLSDEYIHDKFLPDKAIDILDEVGSRFWIEKKSRKSVSVQDVEQVIAKMSNTPQKSLSKEDKSSLRTLSSKLKKNIFGQDEAIDEIYKAILISKAGLKQKNKPIASFLFTGQSGVGKTELARELANNMGVEFARFDMSEFMEKHSVSKLIGAPAGYVGFESGGQLTDLVKKKSHLVLLLDEIEKANEELINILLQVMDNAILTDNNGTQVNFSHVIIIMTSNITSNNAINMGFKNDEKMAGDRNIKNFFTKEFINRLTSIVRFKPLGAKHINKVIDKTIENLLENINQSDVKIKINQNVKDEIYKRAQSDLYGARNIQRVANDLISYEIGQKLLFSQKEIKNKTITISFTKNEVSIKIS